MFSFDKRIKQNSNLYEIYSKGSVAFFLGIGSKIFGVLLNFIIARYYGANIVGILAIMSTIVLTLSSFGILGFSTSIQKFVPKFKIEHNEIELEKFYKQIIKILGVSSFSIALLFVLFANTILIEKFNFDYLSDWILMISCLAIFQIFIEVNYSFLKARKKIKLVSTLQFLHSFFSVALLGIITVLAYNIFNPIYVYTLLLVIVFFVLFIMVKKDGRFSFFSSLKGTKNDYWSLIKNSQPMFISSIILFIMGHIDIIMLGLFVSEDEIGIYSIALKVSLLVSFLLVSFNTIVAPKISELHQINDLRELKKIYHNTRYLTFTFALFAGLIFMIWSNYIMQFFGSEFEYGELVLIILVFGQIINCFVGPVGVMMNMTGYENIFMYIMSLAIAINILLNFIFIPKYGIEGAAISSTIALIFWNFVAWMYLKTKKLI